MTPPRPWARPLGSSLHSGHLCPPSSVQHSARLIVVAHETRAESTGPPGPLFWLTTINGCKSWTVKKAEHRSIDAFELWCWRRLLRIPWTARRSNQSILKEISPGCSLEGLMLKLKLPILWPPHTKSWLIGKDWCWEGLGAGGEGDDRGWDSWMASPTRCTWVWVNSGSW